MDYNLSEHASMSNVEVLSDGSWEDHVQQKIDLVLMRLSKAGLNVNAAKSFFRLGKVECLGYLLFLQEKESNQC
jgi:hypothetical protein